MAANCYNSNRYRTTVRLQERILGLQPITLFGHTNMPRPRNDQLNKPWSMAQLTLIYSLVFAGHIVGVDDRLQAMKSGDVSLEELLSVFEIFEERLRPGIFSKAGLSWLESHRGQAVAVMIAQCPQREAHFQLKGGCKTTIYVDALIAEV